MVSDYLGNDPESQGWAVRIEGLNPDLASDEDYAKQTRRFPPKG